MSKNLRAPLCAVLAAFFWGSTFVAQDIAAEAIGPFTYTASRSWLGAALLLVISLLLRKKITIPTEHKSTYRRDLLWGGLACGVTMTVAANLQQAGIGNDTDPGKAGFITSLYVVLVPIFGLFLRRRTTIAVWISVVIAVVGLYLLCVTKSLAIQLGDLLVLLCAVFFAIQILIIDRLPHIHGIHLCCTQLTVVAVVSTVLAVVVERPSPAALLSVWGAILYSAVFSSALAYTLQIMAQKGSNPTTISLLLCLESVFAVLCAAVIQGQIPSLREGIGCILMFTAVVLANLPFPQKEKNNP